MRAASLLWLLANLAGDGGGMSGSAGGSVADLMIANLQDGWGLRHASERLRDDEAVVRAAVAQSGETNLTGGGGRQGGGRPGSAPPPARPRVKIVRANDAASGGVGGDEGGTGSAPFARPRVKIVRGLGRCPDK